MQELHWPVVHVERDRLKQQHRHLAPELEKACFLGARGGHADDALAAMHPDAIAPLQKLVKGLLAKQVVGHEARHAGIGHVGGLDAEGLAIHGTQTPHDDDRVAGPDPEPLRDPRISGMPFEHQKPAARFAAALPDDLGNPVREHALGDRTLDHRHGQESAGCAPPLQDAPVDEVADRLADGHAADAGQFGQFAFGGNAVAGAVAGPLYEIEDELLRLFMDERAFAKIR